MRSVQESFPERNGRGCQAPFRRTKGEPGTRPAFPGSTEVRRCHRTRALWFLRGSACRWKNIKDGTPGGGHTPAGSGTDLQRPRLAGDGVHSRTFCNLSSHNESTWKTPLTGACRARYCAGTTSRNRNAPRTMPMPGNPRGRAFRCGCSPHEVGRRRAIGVVAVLQSSPSRPRRWCDAGTPEADQKAGAPGSPWPRTYPISRAMDAAPPGNPVESTNGTRTAALRLEPGNSEAGHTNNRSFDSQ